MFEELLPCRMKIPVSHFVTCDDSCIIEIHEFGGKFRVTARNYAADCEAVDTGVF